MRVAGEEGDMQIHVHSLRDFLKDAYRRVADSAFYAADFGLKLVASLSEFRVEEP